MRLHDTLENIAVQNLFDDCAYLFDLKQKMFFKTADFKTRIWENESAGDVIQNGENSILVRTDEGTLFVDDSNGEIIDLENFISFDVQLNLKNEKDFIFGYKNAIYKDGMFFKDIGYFSSQLNEFLVLKPAFKNGRILSINTDNILFLTDKELILFDHNFNEIWVQSLEKLKINNLNKCFDYQKYAVLIYNAGELLILEKESGNVHFKINFDLEGKFQDNFSVTNNGMINFLGAYTFLEFSINELKIINKLNFQDKKIWIKKSSKDDLEKHIYFSAEFDNQFPNMIGIFDTETKSFIWDYKLETQNDGNAFFEVPKKVGNKIIANDLKNNLYIFEK